MIIPMAGIVVRATNAPLRLAVNRSLLADARILDFSVSLRQMVLGSLYTIDAVASHGTGRLESDGGQQAQNCVRADTRSGYFHHEGIPCRLKPFRNSSNPDASVAGLIRETRVMRALAPAPGNATFAATGERVCSVPFRKLGSQA